MTALFALTFLICGATTDRDCEDGTITARMECARLESYVRDGLQPGQRLTVLACEAAR